MRTALVTCFVGLIAATAGVAQGQTVFFDDFRDGSVTNDVPLAADGTPVRWTASFGSLDASTMDLVVSGNDVVAGGRPESQDLLSDTSIRTQVRLSSDQGVNGKPKVQRPAVEK